MRYPRTVPQDNVVSNYHTFCDEGESRSLWSYDEGQGFNQISENSWLQYAEKLLDVGGLLLIMCYWQFVLRVALTSYHKITYGHDQKCFDEQVKLYCMLIRNFDIQGRFSQVLEEVFSI